MADFLESGGERNGDYTCSSFEMEFSGTQIVNLKFRSEQIVPL